MVLLLWASLPLFGPADLYLRMDPMVLAGTLLSGRVLDGAFWIAFIPALLFLAIALIAGRFFCGWICPLGTCVDLADRATARRRASPLGRPARTGLRRVKYHVLALILGAALLGVSLVFIAAPIPLVTRFFGLLLMPLVQVAAWLGLDAARPLAASLDAGSIYYLKITYDRFGTQLFLLAMAGAVFLPGLLAPRFWCRYLCPAGAIFSIFGRKPIIRRRVSDACIECGLCRKRCPMNAIPADPHDTRHGECISCETCERICPVAAITFPVSGQAEQAGIQSDDGPADAPLKQRPATADNVATTKIKEGDSGSPPPSRGNVPSPPEARVPRRTFLLTGVAGAGTALLAYTDLASPLTAEGKGDPEQRYTLRPPGALPEPDFLARCVRCGECMTGCPTNTIQPIWFAAGLAGVFSPVLEPTRGPCETTCNACGHLCPTGALRPLPLAEKQHAKLGTARILRHKCLAWEEQRQCVVCDEVCPYDAIHLERVEGNPVAVPFVDERRCAGCGFCEHNCPVRAQRAIIVQPAGAVRIASGSYIDEAAARGLDIDLNRPGSRHPGPGGYEGSGPQGGYEGYGPAQGHGYEGSASSSGYQGGSDLPPGFSESPGAQGSQTSPPYPAAEPAGNFSRSTSDGGLPPGFSEPPTTPRPSAPPQPRGGRAPAPSGSGSNLPPGFSEPGS